ncbi:MAG: hypothetical protein V4574_13010 [Pseudomonadota bacterium]
MSRRPNGSGDDPRVIPFRPRPKPPKPSPRWLPSLKLFLILLAAIAAIRALTTGLTFDVFDVLFVVLLAGSIALADLLGRRS